MNDRKRNIAAIVLEILLEAKPFHLPESVLSNRVVSRHLLNGSNATYTEVKDAVQWLEQQKAIGSDVSGITDDHRFWATANAKPIYDELLGR